jgi:hypothetical protein
MYMYQTHTHGAIIHIATNTLYDYALSHSDARLATVLLLAESTTKATLILIRPPCSSYCVLESKHVSCA